jgi:hypothetical protein
VGNGVLLFDEITAVAVDGGFLKFSFPWSQGGEAVNPRAFPLWHLNFIIKNNILTKCDFHSGGGK